MSRKTILVTGANGYIGNAVTKAFNRAGYRTFGLIRRERDALDLARNEIHPIIGTPDDLSFLDQVGDTVFDVVVSSTEDPRDSVGHFQRVSTMIDEVAGRSRAAGIKPLVLLSSGCKDYGPMTLKHGDPGLAPHTETSPVKPHPLVAPRCDLGVDLLERSGDLFDAVVLRPTIVYGYSSSLYGGLFDLAAHSESVLTIIADPNATMHSVHVDDCAAAYVALAEHADRGEVAHQAFNIPNLSYETADQIGKALAASYGLDLEFVEPDGELPWDSPHALANFWQWVGSDKLRTVTGWSERRPSFVDGIEEFRLARETHNRG